MEKEEALAIIANTIRELKKIKPRGTGIRAKHVKGLVVEDSAFIGLEKALDISEGEDITWRRNIVNNYEQYSSLTGLLEKFFSEATKGETQVNKTVLGKIKEQVLNRWPELAGTTLVIAITRIIESFM